MCRSGTDSRRKLGYHGASRRDALREPPVFWGIDLVETAAEDRDGGAVGGQRAFMTRGVDAERQSAGDREARAREECCEFARRRPAACGAVAAADHGDLRLA